MGKTRKIRKVYYPPPMSEWSKDEWAYEHNHKGPFGVDMDFGHVTCCNCGVLLCIPGRRCLDD